MGSFFFFFFWGGKDDEERCVFVCFFLYCIDTHLSIYLDGIVLGFRLFFSFCDKLFEVV